MIRRGVHGDEGAVAVEFALVLPILMILLLGIITGGLSYSHALGVTNAVREGSRAGATADACGATPPPACTGGPAWAATVMQRVRDTQFDDPSSQTKVCVQLVRVTAAATPPSVIIPFQCSVGVPTVANSDLPAVPTTSTTVGMCFVQVVAARPFTINIGVQKWDRVLIRTSIARYERKDKLPVCM